MYKKRTKSCQDSAGEYCSRCGTKSRTWSGSLEPGCRQQPGSAHNIYILYRRKRKPHVKLNLGKKKSFSCKDSVFHLAKYTFVLFHSDVQHSRILGVSHFSKPHIYKTETIKNSFFKKNRNTAVPLSLCSLSLSSLQNCILVTYRALKTLTTTTTVENIQNSFKAK